VKTALTWKEQCQIIDKCIHENIKLSDALTDKGFSYNMLNYKEPSDSRLLSSSDYSPIDKIQIIDNGIRIVSFFSGCGGLDLGFERAGYKHLACIDINEHFCNTLRANRPSWKIIGPPQSTGDVSNRKEMEKELRKIIKPNFNGVFIGGPPCQPFSIAANQRFKKSDKNFKRIGFNHKTQGNLLFDYVWYIRKFKPAAFVIENVTGLLTVDGGKQLAKAVSMLKEVGYHVSKPTVINAVDYGVPQIRKRLFVVGSIKGDFIFPKSKNKKTPCIAALQASVQNVKNHEIRSHDAQSVKRYMMLKPKERDNLGRVNRLDPNKPSLTVIAGGMKGGGRSHLHPFVPRTLSVRESARLQTFPDDFVFYGPIARQFTQVGNAVPPILAFQIAKEIEKQFFKRSRQDE